MWIALFAAGGCEVLATTCIKLSDGLRRLSWMAGFVATMSCSVFLMSLAVTVIPIGTAYAVWTGIGAVGTALVGMLAFGDSTSLRRMVCLALILCGVVGLRLLPAVST
ncbi:MAG: multidrug efflux SMR transporter [Phycisphaerales bacterium]|nr:multidrug efflux SMR transporter [Phycisphaerales bacterium]